MKRILALILAVMTLLSVCSCTDYKPVKSTEEEERVIMTMTIGKEEYEVRYEFYRALFLNHKSEIDGGDASVWVGASRSEYIDRINAVIIDEAANVFAAFYICEQIVDFDLYGSKADKRVEEFVTASVEGGDGAQGFGTYDAYLAYLKSVNLNYSVQDLLYRYYIALEKIDEYFIGDTDADSITDDEISTPNLESPVQLVREFYYSDSFRRVLYAYFSELVTENPDFDLDEFRAEMVSAAKNGREDVERLIGGRTAAQDVETGIFISKNCYNNDMLELISDTAFALTDGEVSETLKVSGTGESSIDGYYILYGIEKSEEDFRTYYTQIKLAYFDEMLGQKLIEHKSALIASVKYSSEYSSVNHSVISM